MDIINAIADIEQKMQEIIDSADEDRKKHEKELEDELLLRERTMQKRLSGECDAIKKRSEAEANDRIAALDRAYEKKLSALKEKCDANKEIWVQKIFDAVIG